MTHPQPVSGDAPWGTPAVAYYAPPSDGRPRTLQGLATALLVLLCIIAAIELIGAFVLFYRSSILFDAAEGELPGQSEADAVDGAVAATTIVHMLLYLAIAAVFIIWQYRHAKNAKLIGPHGGLSPGWAIGGWFIPFANFVLPGVQLYQSGRMSDPTPPGAPSYRSGKGPAIVVVWAVVFGLGWLLSAIGRGVSPSDEFLTTRSDIETAAAADVVGGIAMLVLLAAAVLCIVMVRSLTTLQQRTFETGLTPAPSYGPVAWGQQPWNAPVQPGSALYPPASQPWTSGTTPGPVREPSSVSPTPETKPETEPAAEREPVGEERPDDRPPAAPPGRPAERPDAGDPWRLPPS
jgi:hypothetical protein